MPSLYPVSSGRTNDALNHHRLLSQIAFDQVTLHHKQAQISSGRRIIAPSEDSQAAVRAVSLQRILEQNTQYKTNLQTSESYLGASDNAISDVSQLLIDIRGTALSVVGTTSSDREREAAAITVRNAILRVAEAANKEFRGRYLFGGSETTEPPFEINGEHVIYHGNEGTLRSFADINLLLDTNISGHEVLGGISPEVLGVTNINPTLTTDTRVTDLRGGEGIGNGSIEITDGNSFQIIDISSAVSVGDIVHLIESNAPSGTEIHVRLNQGRFELELLSANPGDVLTVQEVGNGTTAAELGILGNTSLSNPILVGDDLDPILQLTTRLDDAFGSFAQGVASSAGPNNNITLRALQRSDALNGYQLQFVDDDLLQAANGLSAGSETATLTSTATAAQAAVTFSGSNNNLVITANTPGQALNNVEIQISDAGAIGNAAISDLRLAKQCADHRYRFRQQHRDSNRHQCHQCQRHLHGRLRQFRCDGRRLRGHSEGQYHRRWVAREYRQQRGGRQYRVGKHRSWPEHGQQRCQRLAKQFANNGDFRCFARRERHTIGLRCRQRCG